jgi:alpha-N-acetylglucosaminidase
MIHRSLKRYGLSMGSSDKAAQRIISTISKSWDLLTQTFYANDFSTQDSTGIAHLTPRASFFEKDRYTPKAILCGAVRAWDLMILAVQEAKTAGGDIFEILHNDNEPFRYDLINLGREVLAQLSTPMALNFTDATNQGVLDQDELIEKGMLYIELLDDVDALVGTDQGFLLGPWLESARKWGESEAKDCYSEILNSTDCSHFYEFNARCQMYVMFLKLY